MNGPDVVARPGGYRDNLLELVRALALAGCHEQHLAAADLPIVLTGRRAILELAIAVHLDLTWQSRDLVPLLPYDFEVHPVQALGRALHRYPRPPGPWSPTEVAAAEPVSEAGRAWQQAARHATIAAHAWTTGIGADLDPGAQWAGIADAATLAEALSRLDPGLVVTAAAARDGALARTLQGGLKLALGVAARETLRLAALGPLPDGGPDRAPTPDLSVQPVLRPADLPAAQTRLVALLRHGGLLRPERVPLLTGMQIRACMELADAIDTTPRAGTRRPAPSRTGQPPRPDAHRGGPATPAADIARTRLAHALRAHARTLRGGKTLGGQAISLAPGDGRALRQAGEIHRAITAHATALARDGDLLATVVAGLAETTRGLATATTRALASGEWLTTADHHETPNPEATETPWRRREPGDPVPGLVLAVRRAAGASLELTDCAAQLDPTGTTTPARPVEVVTRRGRYPLPATSTRPAVVPAASPLAKAAGLPDGLTLARPRLPHHRPVMAAVPRSR